MKSIWINGKKQRVLCSQMRRLTSVTMSCLLIDVLSSSQALSSKSYVGPDHRLVIITLLQYKCSKITYGQYSSRALLAELETQDLDIRFRCSLLKTVFESI